MATPSRILAWRIREQRSLGGYSLQVCKELDITVATCTQCLDSHICSFNAHPPCPPFWGKKANVGLGSLMCFKLGCRSSVLRKQWSTYSPFRWPPVLHSVSDLIYDSQIKLVSNG